MLGIRCCAPIAFALSLLLTGPIAAAEGDATAKARKTFDSLFGEELKRVQATPQAADDVELAGRLVETARKAGGEPALLALLCGTACDLAGDRPDAYAVALEAAELGLKHAGDEGADAWIDRLIAIRQNQFQAARGDEKADVGETLLGLLIGRAEGCIADLDLAGASAPYGRAALMSRAIRSVRRAEIQGRVAWLTHAKAALAEAELLKAALAKEPGDQATRERLVRLYVVDLDRPDAGAAFVEGVGDGSLAKYVPAAAKDPAAAPELACLELAEWYVGLADAAPAVVKEPLYDRAERYLLRLLDTTDAEDLTRLKGEALLGRIEAARDREFPHRWIDLLARVAPKRHALQGQWMRRGAALACVKPVRPSEIAIPVILRGAYDLRAQFVRTSGREGVGVLLPAGASQVHVFLSAGRGASHGLDLVRGLGAHRNETSVRPGTLENNRAYDLLVRVRLDGGQAAIRVMLDGRQIIPWRGPQEALGTAWWCKFKRKDTPGLATLGATAVFSKVEVRTHSCVPK